MPNRASELSWEEHSPSADGGLTRSAVVRTALEIGDSEGLDAVSIRRVAARLDVRPMSLYTHIASKDDLLALMVNEVTAEALAPEPLPTHWREALAEIARYSHAAFAAHPWVLEAFSRAPRIGPNALRHAEQSTIAVASLGLEPSEAQTVLGIVDDYALGHAARTINLPDHVPQPPDLKGIELSGPARAVTTAAGPPSEETFELGLQVLFDGIERNFVRR